jgi:hypothetical protein
MGDAAWTTDAKAKCAFAGQKLALNREGKFKQNRGWLAELNLPGSCSWEGHPICRV